MDIKFTRNKNDNLQSKAQSYSTLVGTKTIAPEDCLEMADMTTDVAEVVARGKKYWEEQAQQTLENMQKASNINNNGNNSNNNVKNSNLKVTEK